MMKPQLACDWLNCETVPNQKESDALLYLVYRGHSVQGIYLFSSGNSLFPFMFFKTWSTLRPAGHKLDWEPQKHSHRIMMLSLWFLVSFFVFTPERVFYGY